MTTTASTDRPERPESAGTDRKAGDVDVTRLADRVYRLMLAELRLERVRSGMDH